MNDQDFEKDLQDQHLDMMIRLALLHDEQEKIKDLSYSADPEETQEMRHSADRAYFKALQKAEAVEATLKKEKIRGRLHRSAGMVVRVAASIALVVVVGTSIAIATSATFRSKVMKLIMEIDEEQQEANFLFSEDETESFEVPDGWKGEYYPSYFPGEMQIEYMSVLGTDIELSSDNTKVIFSELKEGTAIVAGTERAQVEDIILSDGSMAHVIEEDPVDHHSISVTWAIDDRWFDLSTYGLSKDQALCIVESVKKIIR